MTDNWKVEQGDCRDIMRTLPDNSVDAIVSDPPYGLSFMGKAWDHGVPGVEFWTEALRVAKPGAHLVAFGGTRTYHRLAVAIEDAGWEVRDCLSWLYGSGFPKSLDVSKAMDKMRRRDYVDAAMALGLTIPGNSHHDWTTGEHSPSDVWWERFKSVLSQDDWQRIERIVVGTDNKGGAIWGACVGEYDITVPATDAAKRWHGWGTALKPAWEPIILARKPLSGTVAANVTQYGTGAINVDGCRIEGPMDGVWGTSNATTAPTFNGSPTHAEYRSQQHPAGRWPANVCLDEDAAAVLDAQAGERGAQGKASGPTLIGGSTSHSRGKFNGVADTPFYGDSGGPSRFFYTAKVSRREREAGLDGMPKDGKRVVLASSGRTLIDGEWVETHSEPIPRTNHHPTVKPIALMRWLCRLVTPPSGLILDPFNGSGSTGCAAVLEGFRYLGCELEAEYVEIACRRIAYWQTQRAEPDLFG